MSSTSPTYDELKAQNKAKDESLRKLGQKYAAEVQKHAEAQLKLKAARSNVRQIVGFLAPIMPRIRERLPQIELEFTGPADKDLTVLCKLMPCLCGLIRAGLANDGIEQYFTAGNDSGAGDKLFEGDKDHDKILDVLKSADGEADAVGAEVNGLKGSSPIASAVNAAVTNAGSTVDVAARGALLSIVNAPLPPDAVEEEAPANRGRQPQIEAEALPPAEVDLDQLVCGKCSSAKINVLRRECQRVFRKANQLQDNVTKLCNDIVYLCQCEECGDLRAASAPDACLPVAPNQSISMQMVVEGAVLNLNGIPDNRAEKLLGIQGKFGKTTYGLAKHLFFGQLCTPLYEALQREVMKALAVAVDETRFRCLQQEGKGICAPISPDDIKTLSYLLAVSSTDDSRTPFSMFVRLPGRSAEDIAEAMPALHPVVFITDHYGAYDSSCVKEAFPAKTKHAKCWAHLRKLFVKASGLKGWKAAKQHLQKGCDEYGSIEKYLAHLLAKNAPIAWVYCILYAIRRLYAIERELRRKPGESDESHLARRAAVRSQYSRPFVEAIDRLVKLLAKEHARRTKTGRWATAFESDIADAVVYYLNAREELQVFLDEPLAPLDSSAVERAIRPLTILRKNCGFKQSQEYVDSMCVEMSLLMTAEKCGLERISEWLLDYGRHAFLYAYEKRWKQELERCPLKDLDARIMDWDMAELLKGFDATRWLPWIWTGPVNDPRYTVPKAGLDG